MMLSSTRRHVVVQLTYATKRLVHSHSKPQAEERKMIGVLGGMGPAATSLFQGKLLKAMNARSDQDHIPSLSLNATWVPDRTTSLLSGDPQQTKAVELGLRKGAAILREGGARVICIPCNTAHTWYADVVDEAGSNVKVLHMIDIVSHKMKQDGVKKIALLATHGTRQSLTYEESVSKVYGEQPYEFMYPTRAEQETLYDQGIIAVKSGVPGSQVYSTQEPLVRRLLKEGAERIILGCTEIPLIFDHVRDSTSYLLDPMDELACAAVAECHGPVEEQELVQVAV